MAVPFDPADPQLLTQEQRLDELFAILATGTRRMLALRATPCNSSVTGTTNDSSDSGQTGLEVSGETRLHGPRG